MNIRIYVALFNPEVKEQRKLIVMVEGSTRISMLKRKIEQEFTELFPREKPFIVSKIEDQYGYSLSNNSSVGELLKNDDRIVALPETETAGFISGNDVNELLAMLANMQENISGKLLTCGLASAQSVKSLLFQVLPLCYVANLNTMHNACKALVEIINEGNFRIFEQDENSDLLRLLVYTLNFLINEYMEQDTLVQRSVIELLEVLIKSRSFLSRFKSNSTSQKLVSSSKTMNQAFKAKIIRIISAVNRGEELWTEAEPRELREPREAFSYKTDHPEPYPGPGLSTGHSREAKRPEKQERYKPGTRDFKSSLHETGMGSMVSDFIQMISTQNTSEMICFALHSLENFVSEAVDVALQDPELFSRLFSLIEISTPSNFHSVQSSLLSTLSARLNIGRCEEIVMKNGLTRLLKSYINSAQAIQPAILALFEQTLKLGRKKIDVPSLISISVCAYPTISLLAIEALSVVADPADGTFADEQFENHVRFFVGACVNEKQNDKYRSLAATCVANLSIREYLRPQIIYCGGIDTLLMLVKDSARVEAQRAAAKALVNLTATKRDLKMKVVAELSEEIRKLYRSELDGIVSTYLQTLVSSRS